MNASIHPFPEHQQPPSGTPGSEGLGEARPHPIYTKREAVKAGLCTKDMFDRVAPYVDQTFHYYAGSGTPRAQWTPRPVSRQGLANPHIREAEGVLDDRLAKEVDPRLDALDQQVEAIKLLLDERREYPSDVSTVESEKRLSAADATALHGRHGDKVDRDRAEGAHHHNRPPGWVRRAGQWAPFGEAAGLMTFGSYVMNVDWLRPWDDPLGFTFALVIVLVLTGLQAWTVHHAATAHNQMREAEFEGQNHVAEDRRRARNLYGAAAGVLALGITGAMVERGLTAASGLEPADTVLIVVLALLTGLGLPVLAFFATAFDGSKVSREMHGLAEDLDADRQDVADLDASIEEEFTSAETVVAALVEDTLPSITQEVQRTAEAARDDLLFLHLQIGVDATIPPAEGVSIDQTEDRLVGRISSGVPGADEVNLEPTWDRMARLHQTRERLRELRGQFDALPAHPWQH